MMRGPAPQRGLHGVGGAWKEQRPPLEKQKRQN